ncbi:MAG TPA: peptidyl-prolyl cis-trans isomerase [Clostridia bacterium]|nr:peptidyl-prolyl cis-trans isomerase [Clostridia bacterium]
MFGTIRKHQTWLWVVIITLTVISFVVYFSPYSRLNTEGDRSGDLGSINGEKVTVQQYTDAYREVNLHNFFMTGRWLDEDRGQGRTDVDRDIYQWLLVVQKQKQLGIHVGDEAAAQMGQTLLRSLERAGVNSPKMFADRVLAQKGLNMGDFERYVRHFVGLQELMNTFGLTGKLVTPQEAKALYERDHQEVATAAVFFPASNYLASVQVAPEALTQYYNARSNNYAIPERVQVNYVKFNLTNFMPQAQAQLTNLNELVENNYQRLGTNHVSYFPDAKTPEEAKAKIREELLRTQALTEARKKASDFANNLFLLNPPKPENLANLARTNNLTVSTTTPFDRDDVPKELSVGPDFTKAAFGLNAEEPYAGPIIGRDGVYVIGMNKTLPREVPTLAQVRDRVTTEFKQSQAREMAWRAGSTFHNTLTNSLSQGRSFADIAAAANVKPVELPPFSISTQNLPKVGEVVSLNQLKQAAFSTGPGKASPVIPTAEGSMVLFVKSKLPIDQAKVQTELPNYIASLRRARQQEAFDDWFRKEMEKGLQNTPLARQQPPPAMMPAGGDSKS